MKKQDLSTRQSFPHPCMNRPRNEKQWDRWRALSVRAEEALESVRDQRRGLSWQAASLSHVRRLERYERRVQRIYQEAAQTVDRNTCLGCGEFLPEGAGKILRDGGLHDSISCLKDYRQNAREASCPRI